MTSGYLFSKKIEVNKNKQYIKPSNQKGIPKGV